MFSKLLKYFAFAIAIFSSSNSFSQELYAKMRPTYNSIEELSTILNPLLEEANNAMEGRLIYDTDYWHMTINPLPLPEHIRPAQVRDYSTDSAYKYQIHYLQPKIKKIADIISTVDFKVIGTAIYGRGERKFLVLELEPDLSWIKDKSTRTKIRRRILESKPHLSIARFESEIGISKQSLFYFFKKVRDILDKADVTVNFNRIAVEISPGQIAAQYSTRLVTVN